MANGIDQEGYKPSLTPLSPITPKPASAPFQLPPVPQPTTVTPTRDSFSLGTVAGKVSATMGEFTTYAKAKVQQWLLTPLSDNAVYLFNKVIPLEIRQLAQKWKSGTINETERAKLNTYLDMNKVKNRYEFLNRIAIGDLTTASDTGHQQRYQLYVSKADVTANGTVLQDGNVIDPRFAVISGTQALITRDENNHMMSTDVILLLREGARMKLERFTVYYLKEAQTEQLIRASGGGTTTFTPQIFSPHR